MNNKTIVKVCSWTLAALVLGGAYAVWAGERLDGGGLTSYDLFPLLGLGAFSLMWTHYLIGSLRRTLGVGAKDNRLYSRLTSLIVLIMILLHPGILITQLYKDGFGLPPQSYLGVYAEAKLALAFGSVSLVIFLLFELHRKFKNRSWWKYIDYLQIVAMGLIFFHGLNLGRELSVEWYRAVWYLYGLSLTAAILYNYWYDKRAVKE